MSVTSKERADELLQTVFYDVADITADDALLQDGWKTSSRTRPRPWEDIDGIGGVLVARPRNCSPADNRDGPGPGRRVLTAFASRSSPPAATAPRFRSANPARNPLLPHGCRSRRTSPVCPGAD